MLHRWFSGRSFSDTKTSHNLFHSRLAAECTSFLMNTLSYGVLRRFNSGALARMLSRSFLQLTTTRIGLWRTLPDSRFPNLLCDRIVVLAPITCQILYNFSSSHVAPSNASSLSGTPSTTMLVSFSLRSVCWKNCCFVIISGCYVYFLLHFR